MKYSMVFAAVAGSAVASRRDATPDACASACTDTFQKCGNADGANQSACTVAYEQCLGYNPFNGGYKVPTSCASQTITFVEPAPTATAAATASSTATPDACASACTNTFKQCGNAPGANQSACTVAYEQCLGFNPFNGGYKEPTSCASQTITFVDPAPTGAPADACAAACNDAFNKCSTAPEANHSFCASEYFGCLGYNPFMNGNTAVPSTCSSSQASTMATATSSGSGSPASASASVSATTSAATATATPDACAAACNDAFNKCSTAPEANHSFCASEYFGCLGFNPFLNGNTAEPTTCAPATSTGGAPVATGTGAAGSAPTAGGSPAGGANGAGAGGAPAGGAPAGGAPAGGAGAGAGAGAGGAAGGAAGTGAAPPRPTNGTSPDGTVPFNGAGMVKPGMALLALGALALL